jgi:hypothetical protein
MARATTQQRKTPKDRLTVEYGPELFAELMTEKAVIGLSHNSEFFRLVAREWTAMKKQSRKKK